MMKAAARHIIAAVAAIAILCSAALAVQAAPPAVPSGAEPSRINGQLPQLMATPPPETAAPPGPAAPAAAPPGMEGVTLTLKNISIAGMTVYRQADVAYLYKPLLGKKVTLADIFGVAAKLTAKYRNDGYILSQAVVPPQTIDSGEVTLQVVEGFVDKVMFQGVTEKKARVLAGYAERIRAARPLNSKTLERYLLLMNDLAGVAAHSVLSPSQTPGASDLIIVVAQERSRVTLQADNRGSKYLGPFQASVGAQANGLFASYDSLNVQAALAPQGGEMIFGGFTWRQPLGHEGTQLSLGYNVTSTVPGFTLTPFGERGTARAASFGLSHPFVRSRAFNVSGAARFDYLDSFRSDTLGLGRTRDRLRVLRVSGSCQRTDSLMGVNTLNVEVSKGLALFNASRTGDTGLSRARGDPQFLKATAEAARLQRLKGPFSLYGAVTGQKSADTLPASEEFGVGGAAYGSAYDNSEITGEHGLAARAELRADNPFHAPIPVMQFYGFYDVGTVWDIDNAVHADRRRSLASAGAGLRTAFNANISASIEVAAPLTRDVATEMNRRPRVFGALTLKY